MNVGKFRVGLVISSHEILILCPLQHMVLRTLHPQRRHCGWPRSWRWDHHALTSQILSSTFTQLSRKYSLDEWLCAQLSGGMVCVGCSSCCWAGTWLVGLGPLTIAPPHPAGPRRAGPCNGHGKHALGRLCAVRAAHFLHTLPYSIVLMGVTVPSWCIVTYV